MRSHSLHVEKGIVFDAKVSGDCMAMLEGFVVMSLRDRSVKYYKIEEGTIFLKFSDYNAEKNEYIKLPYPLTVDNAVDFLNNWLVALDHSNLKGNGQALGFEAELKSFGDYDIKIEGVWVYYGK